MGPKDGLSHRCTDTFFPDCSCESAVALHVGCLYRKVWATQGTCTHSLNGLQQGPLFSPIRKSAGKTYSVMKRNELLICTTT